MSRKFLTSIDLARNEIQNAVLQVLAADPSTPVPGQMYYSSTVQRPLFRNATAFIDLTARANHSGTQLAATISDFDTQVRTNRLDQMAAPTALVNMGGQTLSNLGAPANPTDAATKAYVDATANGTDWKDSVRAATTANITLSGFQSVDGITLAAGERVLVKNQTTASANGIYIVSGGAWTRAADADNTGSGAIVEVSPGMSMMVEEGSTQASTQWRLTTSGVITVGTTSLNFAQIGAATTYTAGTGIKVVGNVISIEPTVVVSKFAQTLATSATSIPVTHGLNTLDVQVEVYEVASGATVECDIVRTNVNTVTLGFAVAPASNSLRVVVQG